MSSPYPTTRILASVFLHGVIHLHLELIHLELSNFLGHSANAVRWQVYSALLVYVLLRFMAHLSQCGHSFSRLFTVSRSALWERLDLLGLLKSYGTASGPIYGAGGAQ